MSKPMTDSEVISEMKKLAKIVRQETTSIDALHAKRRKQVEVQKRITQSTLSNKARLQQLQMRDQLLQDVFEEAKKGLSDLTTDQDKYRGILENLTLQVSSSLPSNSAQYHHR
ncbi:V-ATPase V1 sector subunit E [Puccinia graminis f. sp. tritici]|uniref:V-ATPase V1 sector subunit E n=1 Tax=Puccinia graminis f. sp. tritici TaxID=56615 RepID=A0A5B0RDX7_PUCGR|nr:V-ATPase V1 sector subunit E [Puccinia graminis f. sp. tritici]